MQSEAALGVSSAARAFSPVYTLHTGPNKLRDYIDICVPELRKYVIKQIAHDNTAGQARAEHLGMNANSSRRSYAKSEEECAQSLESARPQTRTYLQRQLHTSVAHME